MKETKTDKEEPQNSQQSQHHIKGIPLHDDSIT